MSGITFATYSAPSHSTAASAPASDQAAVKEQSFRSAVNAQPISAHSSSTGHDPGPVTTTLALGEEDGGGMSMAPEPGGMSSPVEDGDFQVTTLAIGEEDGGGAQLGYGSMSPIGDDHGVIGGGIQTDRLDAAGMDGLPEGYGTMQPIYSPGEAEYPAFAKTSETPDLLNFHPVARIPKTQVTHSVPVAPPPAPVYAPVTAQPMVIETAPIGEMTQGVPVSGNYQSIGSYEDYIRGLSGGTAAPAAQAPSPAMQSTEAAYAPTEPVYEPVATTQAYEPQYESVSTQTTTPVYEPHQPAAATSVYDQMQTSEPAPAYEASPTYEPVQAAPVEAVQPETTTPVYETAPTTSAEPQEKPVLFEKDTPFDFKSNVEPADPADGNPDYIPPAEAAKTESAPAAKAEASYVNVPLDAYLVEPTGGTAVGGGETPSPAAEESNTVKEAEAAPSIDTAPEVAPSVESKTTDIKAPETMSLGGSYTVMDQTLPVSVTGASSGMGSGGPETATKAETASDSTMPDTSSNELRIMTLAIGEEAGSQ